MYQGQDTLHYAIGRAGRLCTSITSCRTHFPRSSQLMYRIGASPNLHVFLAPHGACGEDLAFTLNPVAGKVGGGPATCNGVACSNIPPDSGGMPA